MKYKLSLVLLVVLIIPLVMATTIGITKANDCINLPQVCENCTSNNISTILYPNKTIAKINISMSKDDTYYNYSFCNTSTLGEYIVNGVGDLDGVRTSWAYNFEVTGTGFEFNQSRSTFYIGSLAVLVFLFVITVIMIPKIPNGNDTDSFGMVISINKLKYIRPVLYGIAYSLLLAITFLVSNVATAYMGSSLVADLFFVIYQLMYWMMIPMIFIWFAWFFVQLFRDREVKRLIERGLGGNTL